MRLKTVKTSVVGEYTRDGKTIPVNRVQSVRVPAMPINWQVVALRAAVGIVLLLTTVAVAWSTKSIGSLLGGGVVGYAAATIFDLGWAMALLLEYLARYDKNKRSFPERLGWTLLVFTMVAIGWEGLVEGSVPMAVIGATVSLFAKVLWMGVMKHINADLSEDDQAWLAHEISSAQTEAAIAQMRRQTERTKRQAALELLAMEREEAMVSQSYGLGVATAVQVEACATEAVALALEPPTLADMSKSDAVRFVLGQCPELDPSEVADVLGDHGVEVEPAYVKQIINRKKPEPEMATVVELHK